MTQIRLNLNIARLLETLLTMATIYCTVYCVILLVVSGWVKSRVVVGLDSTSALTHSCMTDGRMDRWIRRTDILPQNGQRYTLTRHAKKN